MRRPTLFGILNLTSDSFSDGGKFLDPARALQHALRMHAAGADVIDVGAAASNPHAAVVSPAEELERLTPIVAELGCRGVPVSLDTNKPEVLRALLTGVNTDSVAFVNDIDGFRAPGALELVAPERVRLIVMHRRPFGTAPPASAAALWDEIERFFEERLRALAQAGIAPDRILLDPGMGLFLGEAPHWSLTVVRDVARLRSAFGLPVLLSVSRKSFIGRLLEKGAPRPPAARAAGTLAVELFAAEQGVDALRTHDPGALADALELRRALQT